MMHSFDVDVACACGVVEAVLLNNIYFWVEKNRANEKHFYDGYYWTYNSHAAMAKLFPYMNERQIKYAIKKLKEMELIDVGNYNKMPMDKTSWYRLTEKGYAIVQNCPSKVQNCPIDSTKLSDAKYKNVQAIPYINTDINTDSKTTIAHSERISASDLEDFFDSVWQMYPKKKGKGRVSKTKKQVLYRIGKDELQRCIERYVKDFRKEHNDIQYMMHGSTFFNSGYVDYLDENVLIKEEIEDVKETNGINLWD